MSMLGNFIKLIKLVFSSEFLNNFKIIWWNVIYNKLIEYIFKDLKFEILINI